MDMGWVRSLMTELKNGVADEKGWEKKLVRLKEKLQGLRGQIQHVEKGIREDERKHEHRRERNRGVWTRLQRTLRDLPGGFKVKTLEDVHLVVDLWDLGISGFKVEMLPTLDVNEAMKMSQEHGDQYSFIFWSKMYRDLSEEKLDEEVLFLEAECRKHLRDKDRLSILSGALGALKAERCRREAAEAGERQRPPRRDHWRASKDD